jgi:hypothetical protein
MSANITYTEPKKITIGDTVVWERSFSNYSPGVYSLKYKIVGTGGASSVIEAEASGSTFRVTVSSQISALTAGIYRLVGWIEGADDFRETICQSSIELGANLAAAVAGTETREFWQKMKDAIKDVMLNRGSLIQNSMTLPGAGSRSIQYLSHDELYRALKRCDHELRLIASQERIAAGLAPKKIRTYFV